MLGRYGWRVVQALGASAGVALARAMVRDLYDRDHAAKVLSTLMTIMAVAPLLGPSVGAQILEHASWRAIFWTLVAIGLLVFVAIITLPETLPAEERTTSSPGSVIAGYFSFLNNRHFVGRSAAIGFFCGGLFANVAGMPFAYITYYHQSPQTYALLFAANIIGLMIANVFNSKLVVVFDSERMLLVGTVGAACSGGLAVVASGTGWGGIYGLVTTVFIYSSMNGFILANAVAGALSAVATRTGAASALIGAIQYGSGMVGSALVGLLADGTPRPMGAIMALGGVGRIAAKRRFAPEAVMTVGPACRKQVLDRTPLTEMVPRQPDRGCSGGTSASSRVLRAIE